MKGLIIKDLLNLKKQSKTFLIIVVLYIVISVVQESSAVFQGVIVIMFSMLPITALAYDERTKWDKFALTMPLSRNDLVYSKYILGFITTLTAAILCLVIQLVTIIAGKASFDESTFVIPLLFFSIGLIYASVNLPVMIKLGTEKGRYINLAIAAVIIIIPIGIQYLGMSGNNATPSILIIYLLPLISLIIYVLSAQISVKIFTKKEF